MADEDQQGGAQEKTEEPTQRRIQEAVKKGQVISSKEVTNFLMIVVLLFNIAWFLPYLMKRAVRLFGHFIQSPHDIIIDRGSMSILSWQIVGDLLSLVSIPFIAVVLAAFLSHFVQHGFIFTADPILPKLEKISPLKGLKRMFSMRSLVEFIKGLIKITLVGIVAYMVVMPELGQMDMLTGFAIPELLKYLSTLAFRMAMGAAIVMGAIALLDFLYQRYEYMKNLRMSRQELKEEFKQTEGDPVIKARLKQLRQEKARQRMMASVPQASVVITNPTHYAVALKYEEDNMTAPILVAKGADAIALKIREVAEVNKIPVVENPPLARSLYTSVDLEEEIPLEFYQAVAEVIGYVYRLKGKLPKRAAAAKPQQARL